MPSRGRFQSHENGHAERRLAPLDGAAAAAGRQHLSAGLETFRCAQRDRQEQSAQAEVIQMLLARLARISADSPWAYKASGLRGSLMRYLDELEAAALASAPPPAAERLNALLNYGFEILEKVAQATAK